jgi:hypothetical protein
MGLELNREKTRVVDLGRVGESLDFRSIAVLSG